MKKIVVNFIRIRYTFVVVGMFSKYFVGNKLHKERETKGGSKTNGKREREKRERENTNQINEYLSICTSDLVVLIRKYLT